MSGWRHVRLPAAVRRAIAGHALDAHPSECCGFLVGRGSNVSFAVPMTNVAADGRRRFRIDDRAHIELRRTLRAFAPSIEIVGVYHSHPNGRPEPSAADLAEALYPDWVYVIAAARPRRTVLGAFVIAHGRARRLRML